MSRKLTNEEFKKKIRDKFEDKFDLSLVEYKGYTQEVTIVCPLHGEQHVRPDSVLKSSYGCPECALEARRLSPLEKGQTFNRWTILEFDESSKYREDGSLTPHNKWKYVCKCSCIKQTVKSVTHTSLITGRSKSCGCWKSEVSRNQGFANRKTNPIEVCGDITKIFFLNKKGLGEYTIIDTEDYDKVRDFCWHKSVGDKGEVYAEAGSRGKYEKSIIKMHQIICPCDEHHQPDHKNNNGLDNRKKNLRPLTQQQNTMNRSISSNNTSGVTGVAWLKHIQKWQAYITVDHKRKNLGYYHDSEFDKAVKARKEAEDEYFGECSYDNSEWED